MSVEAAIARLRQGDFPEATRLYRQVLQHQPDQPAVLVQLARTLAQVQRFQEALEALDRALRLDARFAEAWYARGNICLRSEQPLTALEAYERFLALVPSHANAWCNRGNALQQLGRPAEAVGSYDRALALDPDLAAAYNNRGNALRVQQRFEEALQSYQRALRLDPRLAEAHDNSAVALLALNCPAEALQACERALALRPNFIEAVINRGNALRDLLQPEQALESYDCALRLDPDCAEAHANRGNALLDLKRYAEALASYERALLGLPESADVLANRATALQNTAQHRAAVEDLTRLLQLAPEYPYGMGRLLQSQLHRCDWRSYSQLSAQILAGVEQQRCIIHPFTMLAVSSSARLQLAAAKVHAARIGRRTLSATALPAWPPREKLRLAYISGDFRDHAMAYLMAGVFEQHSRAQFETLAISLLPPEQSVAGARILNAFDRFVDVSGHSDDQIVRVLRSMQIDIAVDLMGYTQHARPAVLAQRVAPVQVNYLGYPGTSGAAFMDYILADPFLIPERMQPQYAERIAYLPECFQANDDQRRIDAIPTRAQGGLPEQALVLCCFNNSYKLNPPMFDIWMRLLQQLPDSVLWLLSGAEDTRENLLWEAEARNVAPERLVFAARLPYAEHLGRLTLADLFLDTLPFNAGTTASDALRAGVPVLTCAGEAFASRMAGSLLTALGLPDLITHDLADYEKTALELGQCRERLTALRTQLASNLPHSILMDTRRFTRQLEGAYLSMHERARRGLEPANFAVPLPTTA
jgi:protein O-GlcNAc transferase